MSTIEQHSTPREIVTDVLWIWIFAALVMTGALVVVGGAFVLQGTVVRIVLGAMLVAANAFFVAEHRRRAELLKDPRLRAARERPGF